MDIKARIDTMSEAEAKAVLGSIIMTIALKEPCRCPYYNQCNSPGTSECAELWLENALKEAEK